MDAADAFWAARIAARFSDEMLWSIVDIARLSDPAAARYLGDVLIKRRDKVVGHWIAQTTPLDDFVVAEGTDGLGLSFDNAAVRLGVARPAAGYRARWASLDNQAGRLGWIGGETSTIDGRVVVPVAAWGPRDANGARYAAASIAVDHPDHPHWVRPVRVTLRQRDGAVDIVGIERPTGAIGGSDARH
jgi:hypothetical protein